MRQRFVALAPEPRDLLILGGGGGAAAAAGFWRVAALRRGRFAVAALLSVSRSPSISVALPSLGQGRAMVPGHGDALEGAGGEIRP